eukprot:450260_1
MGKSVSCIVQHKADDIDIDIEPKAKISLTEKRSFTGLPIAMRAIHHYFIMHLTDYNNIPFEIIKMTCGYCGLQSRYSLRGINDNNTLNKPTNQFIIGNVYIPQPITCNQNITKITIFGDLTMGSDSKIEIDTNVNNYQLKLFIFGHFQMKSYSEIATNTSKCGNIYIHCNKFTMEKYSTIQCCDKIYLHNSEIKLNVRKSVIMKTHSRICAGHIHVKCESMDHNAVKTQDKGYVQVLQPDFRQ